MNAVTLTQIDSPFAAWRWRAVLREIQYEFIRLARNRLYALSVLGLPLLFYAVFGLSQGHAAARYLIVGYSCMGLGSACLFGIGLSIAFERAHGWLELKWASPMPRLAYLTGKLIASAVFALLVLGLLLTFGHLGAGVTVTPLQIARLALILLVGSVPFTALGLVIALWVPPNAGAGLINLIYLPLCLLSGFWIPVAQLPPWMQRIAPLLPTYHLAELALAVLHFAPRAGALTHWLVLVLFSALMFAVAWITFLRSDTSTS
ncbi:MAG: ABC transporter permease [Steroidobacteraceae bacterium]